MIKIYESLPSIMVTMNPMICESLGKELIMHKETPLHPT